MPSRFLAVVLLQLAVACASANTGAPAGTAVAVPAPSTEDPEAPGVAAAPARPAQPTSDALPVDSDDLVWGSPTAPVTLVEFTDLQCPFCARVTATLETLKRDYGPENLRIVVKHNPLPFHGSARGAARFAQAVNDLGGSQAGFEFLRRAFEAQQDLDPEHYAVYAREIGLDPARVQAQADSPAVASALDRDMSLAKDLGANGTPTFFANGVEISGAQPAYVFRQKIDAELAKAAELARSGTPANRVFATLVARDLNKQPEPVKDEPPAPDLTVWKVPVAGAASRGAQKPLVTIVEFTDYQCPFCKRAEQTVQDLLNRYPDDVRLVVRHNPLPFHKRAKAAATLAIEARVQRGDAVFFQVAARIFERAPDLEEPVLLEIAREFKLNEARVKAALAKGSHDKTIDDDSNLALDLEARGVPHFFINGVRLAGAQPLESFVEAVEREREKAKALVAQGTPRSKVYAEIMKAGREPALPEQKVVPIPADSPSRGPANAPVVIQVFSDFQCPFCRRVEATIADLDRKYPGQLRWVFRNLPLPFHKQARPAAQAALEARAQKGEGAFWTMHDRLFAAQEVEGGLSEANMEAIAVDMGLDMNRFRAAVGSGSHDAAIDRDADAAQQAGINGTPSFLINDFYLSGAQPIAAFEKLIKLAKAQQRKKPAPAPVVKKAP
jgi:protein-disulfide isomerase